MNESFGTRLRAKLDKHGPLCVGLDTHDRFGGERSPAGPKYNRSGTQRMTWHDPFGFVGLDKAAPPNEWPAELERREKVLRIDAEQAQDKIGVLTESLPGLALELQALALDGGMSTLYEERARALSPVFENASAR